MSIATIEEVLREHTHSNNTQLQEDLVPKLDAEVEFELVNELQIKVKEVLRCAEKQDQEKIVILCRDTEKNLLDTHEERIVLLENTEELE